MNYKNYISLFCCMLVSLFIPRLSIAEGKSNSVTYVDETDKKAFSSDVSDNDVRHLAQSIELKVYKIRVFINLQKEFDEALKFKEVWITQIQLTIIFPQVIEVNITVE